MRSRCSDRTSKAPRVTRRAALAGGAALGLTLAIGHSGGLAAAQPEPEPARWPALALRIPTSPPGSAPAVDLRRDFGAVGDGATDDGPALRALAVAVNAGRVPAGAVVRLPAGEYRVVGNEPVVFRRPVVLRGDGPAATVLRLEYTAPRSVFLQAVGRDMYVRHSVGHYRSGPETNRYPDAPFSPVVNVPRRGDTGVVVAAPALFTPGDHVYLLCDDYGPEVVYTPTNRRLTHYLLKQHAAVRAVEGDTVWLDVPLRHDFAGAAPRLYRWQPLSGFGLEHLTLADASTIPDSDEANTFRAVHLDGVVDGWVWNVHFLHNTSIPLTVGRSRRVVVCEALFDGARHVGAGGNGYLPELYFSDDCLVEYCTAVGGRHALICNWSCWGNVFRYNRVVDTPNTEMHGEYNVENLYLRNDARRARMEVGGGGTTVHAHDGSYNELRENYARVLRVLKPGDRATRLVGNWCVEPVVDHGAGTVQVDTRRVSPGWDGFPFAAHCGHDHAATAESARPV